MLYTNSQPQNFLSSGEEVFQCFSQYMGMAAIWFKGTELFEQIINILSTEGPLWNLVKIVQAGLEKKTFEDFTILWCK